LVSLNLKIPNYISGNYFFYVATDNTKRVFEGEFEISSSPENSDVLFVKNLAGTVLKIRKLDILSTTANSSGLSVD
jgi:hypothetical protein